MEFAPIAVFAYNRPNHLKNLLLSLQDSSLALESDVIVFLDGPRNDHDKEQQVLIKSILAQEFRFKSLQINLSEENKGLAASIRAGVTHVLSEHEQIIVLEDDLIVASDFLRFMNSALKQYSDERKVASIHGYQYPLSSPLDKPVFFRGADCWGWATWRDRWNLVSFDSTSLMVQLEQRDLVHEFNLSGGMDYFGMLRNQSEGKVDSWAICWHASMFLLEKLTLFPPKSLVKNLGNDGSGIHSGSNNFFETEFALITEWDLPVIVEESIDFTELLSEFYRRSLGRKNFLIRLARKISKNIGIL